MTNLKNFKIFCTFKTIEVVVVRSATKFRCAFSNEKQNCFLLAIVKIKINRKLGYALYILCASFKH